MQISYLWFLMIQCYMDNLLFLDWQDVLRYFKIWRFIEIKSKNMCLFFCFQTNGFTFISKIFPALSLIENIDQKYFCMFQIEGPQWSQQIFASGADRRRTRHMAPTPRRSTATLAAPLRPASSSVWGRSAWAPTWRLWRWFWPSGSCGGKFSSSPNCHGKFSKRKCVF